MCRYYYMCKYYYVCRYVTASTYLIVSTHVALSTHVIVSTHVTVSTHVSSISVRFKSYFEGVKEESRHCACVTGSDVTRPEMTGSDVSEVTTTFSLIGSFLLDSTISLVKKPVIWLVRRNVHDQSGFLWDFSIYF
jgi:hypothetical protein